MTLPLVSICVPTYNYGRFLAEALRSAQAQTYPNIEIVVSDNCSTDETQTLVTVLARQDPRIRYHRNERNIGMHGNFNLCLELAAGEYIKYLCADDVLSPDCSSRLAEALTSHPDVSLAACGRERADAAMRRVSYAGYSRRLEVLPGNSVVNRCFFYGNVIGEPTAVMFRKRDGERGFSDAYNQLVDLEMWFYLLGRGSFAFIPGPLCKVRQHESQATVDNLKWGDVLKDKQQLFHASRAEANRAGSLFEKLLWDARMAVTVRKTANAGRDVSPAEVREVFFPNAFRTLTYPLASTLWSLTDRRQ